MEALTAQIITSMGWYMYALYILYISCWSALKFIGVTISGVARAFGARGQQTLRGPSPYTS